MLVHVRRYLKIIQIVITPVVCKTSCNFWF